MSSQHSSENTTPRLTFWGWLKITICGGIVFAAVPSAAAFMQAPLAEKYGQQPLSLTTIVTWGGILAVITTFIAAHSLYAFNGYHVSIPVIVGGVLAVGVVHVMVIRYFMAQGDYNSVIVSGYGAVLVWACLNYLFITPLLARRSRRRELSCRGVVPVAPRNGHNKGIYYDKTHRPGPHSGMSPVSGRKKFARRTVEPDGRTPLPWLRPLIDGT